MKQPAAIHSPSLDAYWALEHGEVLRQLDSTTRGLSSSAAADRLRQFGRNDLGEEQRLSRARVLWRQVRSPLLLLLLFAAAVSAVSSEWVDALMVSVIVLATVGIGYRREYGAETAAAALRARVTTSATALRDGEVTKVFPTCPT